MNKTITSLLTLISILDKIDTHGDDTVYLSLHHVPREYVNRFLSIDGADTTAGIDNTWLSIIMPGLEVTVWFE